jgi:hypothetical protein
MGGGGVRIGEYGAPFWSFGGMVVALLALAMTQLVHTVARPEGGDVACAAAPSIAINLPPELPPVQNAAASATPPVVTPRPASATPVSTATPQPVLIRNLFRADDPPGNHALAIVDGPLMPLVLPQPCRLSQEQRGQRPVPCVALLAPGSTLCASGVSGSGRLIRSADAPLFALQADRVTLRDAADRLLIDTVQGYVRYDDPEHNLLLICPRIAQLQTVSSNARSFSATCSNMGAGGWSVSGQVTDGSTAAPDSVGLTITAPDGSTLPLVGPLSAGSILVDDIPGDDH